MISERQRIKKAIYKELLEIPVNKDKLNQLNKELEGHPPNIVDGSRYNFKRREYEKKSIKNTLL